jgi:Protein of unknown function (DUF3606)
MRFVDPARQGIPMQRIKHPPIRNKIDFADPSQVRALSRRLRVPADELKAIVEKVGNSVAAVSKEVELRRTPQQPSAAPAIEVSSPSEPVETQPGITGLTV